MRGIARNEYTFLIFFSEPEKKILLLMRGLTRNKYTFIPSKSPHEKQDFFFLAQKKKIEKGIYSRQLPS